MLNHMQASANGACDCMHAPLHMPETLETYKKSMSCMIKKALRCAADHMSKKQHFLSFTFYKHKDLTRKSYIFIRHFIVSVVKIALYLHFLYTKDGRLQHIKMKHEWWKNRFSDFFTYCINLKNFASLFFLIQDNFSCFR